MFVFITNFIAVKSPDKYSEELTKMLRQLKRGSGLPRNLPPSYERVLNLSMEERKIYIAAVDKKRDETMIEFNRIMKRGMNPN